MPSVKGCLDQRFGVAEAPFLTAGKEGVSFCNGLHAFGIRFLVDIVRIAAGEHEVYTCIY